MYSRKKNRKTTYARNRSMKHILYLSETTHISLRVLRQEDSVAELSHIMELGFLWPTVQNWSQS